MDYWFLVVMCYGAGFLAAFLSMLVASLVGRLWILRTFFCITSLLALLAQGGCWHLMVGIGNATGAHGDDEWDLQKYVALGFVVWFGWTVCLFLFFSLRRSKDDSTPP
jgi:hypothetical protein